MEIKLQFDIMQGFSRLSESYVTKVFFVFLIYDKKRNAVIVSIKNDYIWFLSV